jgi:hypothetical protein
MPYPYRVIYSTENRYITRQQPAEAQSLSPKGLGILPANWDVQAKLVLLSNS